MTGRPAASPLFLTPIEQLTYARNGFSWHELWDTIKTYCGFVLVGAGVGLGVGAGVGVGVGVGVVEESLLLLLPSDVATTEGVELAPFPSTAPITKTTTTLPITETTMLHAFDLIPTRRASQ